MFLSNKVTISLLMSCIMFLWGSSGCVTQRKATLVMVRPTCAQVLEDELYSISNNEAAELLGKDYE